MATRRPLYYTSGALREMSDSQINDVISRVSYLYAQDPSVTLSVVSSGGSLGTISETSKGLPGYSTNASRYPTEEETAEPLTVTINYSKIDETVATVTEPAEAANNRKFPLFVNANNEIQSMTLDDVYDTFIHPAIDNLVGGDTSLANTAGTYHVRTGVTHTGSTFAGAGVYVDLRADTDEYDAAEIPETNAFTTINTYNLFKVDAVETTYPESMLYLNSSTEIQEYTNNAIDTILSDMVRYAAASKENYRIRYSYSTGTNRGTGMVDTILNGAGNYQTRFVGADDYRAQEFPNGTSVTASTNYLKISKS